SPHVAGLAALVWSLDPALTSQQVRTIVQSTCDNIDGKNPNFAGKLGSGRINAFRALDVTPFKLFVFPNNLRLPLASTGTATVQTQGVGGFTAPGALAVPVLRGGVTATFNPDPAPGNSSTLTLTVGPNAPLGTHNLTVRGTGHNVTKSVPFTLRL